MEEGWGGPAEEFTQNMGFQIEENNEDDLKINDLMHADQLKKDTELI